MGWAGWMGGVQVKKQFQTRNWGLSMLGQFNFFEEYEVRFARAQGFLR